MGKVLGIIGEYNPFHNGHLYHIEQSKKLTGANYTVAIISGNFMQRGSTAIMDKWSRAETALRNGIDLVIELPVLFALSSAENFCDGAIKILNELKVVDYLSFGAETSDIDILKDIADIFYKEPREYKAFLANELKKGVSFPKARENALSIFLRQENNPNTAKYLSAISAPNNILGIEYIKALKKYKSKIKPVSIARFEAGYNDKKIHNNIASATAIRNIIKNNNFDVLPKLLPETSLSILLKNIKEGRAVPDLSVFEKQIIYNLRKMTIAEIAELADVSEGLENLLKNSANSCNNLFDLLDSIKSKRYTLTRLQRIMLYLLLGITKKDISISKKTTPYVRVLGFNERGKFLLSEISKANPKLEVITSVKRFVDKNSNKNLKTILDKDLWATDVYTLGYDHKISGNLDFTNKIVDI
ncbi:MAG: nucleotidyltransferase [Clostridia bacterium]|nr:nucleotidyltransferase [Clostridia bacterium]